LAIEPIAAQATATSNINPDSTPNSREAIKPGADGGVRVHVPAASAVMLWLGG
jgi:hypothetical protein